jgi:hypothetical protein
MKEDNARFWVWHRGSWVKLTLTPGQVLSTFESCRTDEGYHREVSTYAHHGEEVVCEWYETGRDCDGRYERGGELVCDLADLAARDAHAEFPVRENVGIKAPQWKRAGGYRRDPAAEAAGY